MGLDYLYERRRKLSIQQGRIFEVCRRLHFDANLPRTLDENGNIAFDAPTRNEQMKVRSKEKETSIQQRAFEDLMAFPKWADAREQAVQLWLMHNPRRQGERKQDYLKRIGMDRNTYKKYAEQAII